MEKDQLKQPMLNANPEYISWFNTVVALLDNLKVTFHVLKNYEGSLGSITHHGEPLSNPVCFSMIYERAHERESPRSIECP